ncbi:MAG: FtsQ-type POTRA domain-containing protein [Humibacillus sp.]
MLDKATRPRQGSGSGSGPGSRAGSGPSPRAGARPLATSTAARASRVAGRGLASSRSRFERRAAAARRRPRLLAGIGVGLLVLVGLVVWLGWFSSVLSATAVEVRGVTGSAAEQVRRVAAVPTGGPLLRVDTDAARERLVAGKAWREISVSRSLPHTVVVEVVPRVAVMAIRSSGGRVDVVDSEGVVFATVASPPAGVPLVTSGSTTVSKPGVAAALQALGALETPLRRAVSGVTVSSADQVSFLLRVKDTTKTVVWGGVGDGDTKAKLVAILVAQPGSIIDVSVSSSPVTR